MAMARGWRPIPTRRAAMPPTQGELAAWETAAVPLAAALNGAKGELGVLNRRRGFADDLEPALRVNNVDRRNARRDDRGGRRVAARLPALPAQPRRGCSATTTALPWWDLFAPVGRRRRGRRGRTPPSRCATRSPATRRDSPGSPTGRSPSAGSTPRSATASGAVPTARGSRRREPRDDELRRQPRRGVDARPRARPRVPQRRARRAHAAAAATPMALAETASIFCETLLFETAVARATDDRRRLALLDTLSRRRDAGGRRHPQPVPVRDASCASGGAAPALSVAELNETMLDAQEAAYGDGLDPRPPPPVHVGGEAALLHAVLQLALHVRVAVRHRPLRAGTRRSRRVPCRLRRPALDAAWPTPRRWPRSASTSATARSGPEPRVLRGHIDDYEALVQLIRLRSAHTDGGRR